MERVTFQNKCGHRLVGIINRPEIESRRFVVLVHGFTGNKDEKGLFVEADVFFRQNGFSVFRFDMRGCGESEGDFSSVGLEDERDDLLSAISFLKEKELVESQSIYLVGFSLGATISIIGYKNLDDIAGFVFWSPAFFPDKDMYPRYITHDIVTALNQDGYFIKSGIKVGGKILNDLRTCDLRPFLSQFHRPTFIAHGEKDDKISIDSSRKAAVLLNGYGSFKAIPNACHSFRTSQEVRAQLLTSTLEFLQSLKQ